MEAEEESVPSIVVPGPELRQKVDHFAARLSTLDKRKADEMVAKLLASPKRNQYLYVDSSHIFYPYFLSKLVEFRQHPEMVPEKKKAPSGAESNAALGHGNGTKADGGGPAPGASTTMTMTTTTTTTDGIVSTMGGTYHIHNPKREELLRRAELEAKRYLVDPFPNIYSLDFKGGSVHIPALVMDNMAHTAQYVAKYGESFLVAVQSKQKHNPAFRFLQTEDMRHEVFLSLVKSYRCIVNFNVEETETRLENLQKRDYTLGTVVAEKTKFIRAAVARRKAALLTDDELRAKLNWSLFEVLKSFTLNDLLLDGPIPDGATRGSYRSATELEKPTSAPVSHPTTLQPPGGAPVFAPVFMSSNLVHSTKTETARALKVLDDPTAAPTLSIPPRSDIIIEENYMARTITPVRRGVEFFVNAETGEKIKADHMQKGLHGQGIAKEEVASLKRGRESYGLASDDEMARELQRLACARQ